MTRFLTDETFAPIFENGTNRSALTQAFLQSHELHKSVLTAFEDARARGALGTFPDLAASIKEVKAWNAASRGEDVRPLDLWLALRTIVVEIEMRMQRVILAHADAGGEVDLDALRPALRAEARICDRKLGNLSLNTHPHRMTRMCDIVVQPDGGGDPDVYVIRIDEWKPQLLIRDFNVKNGWRPALLAGEPGTEGPEP